MCNNNCKMKKDLNDKEVDDMMKVISLEYKAKVLEDFLAMKEYYKQHDLKVLALTEAGKLVHSSKGELLTDADKIYAWLTEEK